MDIKNRPSKEAKFKLCIIALFWANRANASSIVVQVGIFLVRAFFLPLCFVDNLHHGCLNNCCRITNVTDY